MFQALNHPFFFTRPLPCKMSEMPKPNEVKADNAWFLKDFDDIVNITRALHV
jgi:hypothetical protein